MASAQTSLMQGPQVQTLPSGLKVTSWSPEQRPDLCAQANPPCRSPGAAPIWCGQRGCPWGSQCLRPSPHDHRPCGPAWLTKSEAMEGPRGHGVQGVRTQLHLPSDPSHAVHPGVGQTFPYSAGGLPLLHLGQCHSWVKHCMVTREGHHLSAQVD